MSIIKSIKQVLGLGPAAENHFWDGSVANQLSLKRGTPDAPGAELIKALNGVLSFPNQGQSLTQNGYIKLPGGLIIQWGRAGNSNNLGAGWSRITYPIPFPNSVFQVVITPHTSGALSYVNKRANLDATGVVNATFNWVAYNADGTPDTGADNSLISWVAIGY